MCIQDNIQSKIAQLTQDGDTIAVFLADTLQGSSDHAIKICHRMDAAKLLTKYGFPQQAHNNVIPFTPKEDDESEDDSSPSSMSAPAPTLRDIVAYPVARYIRNRTDDGENLVHALCQIMNGGEFRQDPFTGEPRQTVKPRERLAAAKELLRRAFGEPAPSRRNSTTYNPAADIDERDPLNTLIAKLVRDKTNDGIDAAELLIRIAENDDAEGDWLPAHRLSAAKELLHRAYDLNYDAITWENMDAYNNNAYPLDLNEEAERTRHKERISALIKEYDEARAADDEDAMAAAEKEYANYIKYGDESAPAETSEHLEYGPNDPDPTVDYYYPPLSKEEQAKFDEDMRRNSAANIHTPKLTIPLKIRSP